LSLLQEGYTVYANHEASGALNQKIADAANERMRAAGVHVVSMFSVACDLMRDWRNTPGAKELLPFFDRHVLDFLSFRDILIAYVDIRYLATYGYLARGHAAAVDRGTIQPEESE
jgi:hypothetical protein